MRRFRARQRAAGLKQQRRWVSAPLDLATIYSDHAVLEARSLALHCLIARKISRDPRLLDIARKNLVAWKRARGREPLPRFLGEWERLLRRPWPEIAALITDPSCEAARLRQSSPFAGVLDPRERMRVYEAFRA